MRATAANVRLLRELAQEGLAEALDSVAYDRKCLAKLQGGDMDYGSSAGCGRGDCSFAAQVLRCLPHRLAGRGIVVTKILAG